MRCLRGMNLIYQAHVRVAYLQCALKLRRKKTIIPGLCRLDCNSLVAFFVKGLVDEAHAAFANFLDNFKSVGDDLSDFEWPPTIVDQRVFQKAAQSFLSLDQLNRFAIQVFIVFTSEAQIGFALRRRSPKGNRHNGHHSLVVLSTACHAQSPTDGC